MGKFWGRLTLPCDWVSFGLRGEVFQRRSPELSCRKLYFQFAANSFPVSNEKRRYHNAGVNFSIINWLPEVYEKFEGFRKTLGFRRSLRVGESFHKLLWNVFPLALSFEFVEHVTSKYIFQVESYTNFSLNPTRLSTLLQAYGTLMNINWASFCFK